MRYLIISILFLFSSVSAAEVWVRTIPFSYNLPEYMSEIRPFTATFIVFERSTFRAFGHIDVKHRGVYVPDKAVMVGLRIKINNKWLLGSMTTDNIMSRSEHYSAIQVHGYKILEPGVYKISIWMRSVSSSARGVNGIAQIKAGGYNQVVYEMTPIE